MRIHIIILATSLAFLNLAYAESETYQVSFQSNWNAADHAALPGNAHFSPLLAITHDHEYNLVPLGAFASPGLEALAETGATQPIENEMDTLAAHIGDQVITSSLFVRSSSRMSFDIEISSEHPYLSLTSMIAPSPDWIVGLQNLRLYSEESGFHTESTGPIPLYAINAGTENGDRPGNYSTRNAPTSPAEGIQYLSGRGFSAPFAYVTIKMKR